MFETTIISSAQIEVRGRADYFAKAALNALE
jgi:hypothetical protein